MLQYVILFSNLAPSQKSLFVLFIYFIQVFVYSVSLKMRFQGGLRCLSQISRQQQGVHSFDTLFRSMSDIPSSLTSDLNVGMDKWKNKVALVTGASSGIGRAVCALLALSGMRVAAAARRKERLDELQSYVHARNVPEENFMSIVCDVTKEEEVIALPGTVEQKMKGGVDVLVNVAGLARKDSGYFDGNTESWQQMLNTNILGLSMCTREVLKQMESRQQWGHIINVCGESGHKVLPTLEFYSATKYAVRALTHGLHADVRKRGIPLRVSQVSPGRVQTEFRQVYELGDEELASSFYVERERLQPEDVAQSILWCLSAPNRVEVYDVLILPKPQD
eukprot:TRINITY_DN3782_c0_g2_i4.p1 TRINITY_DN3782_c0_g2~~TRINITY_DN3782_c0_g2_i4.p1  ORF type:complete len:335 (+),score=53.84 TRINITY_DN3782_c0_g2_i4:59-1063(+)